MNSKPVPRYELKSVFDDGSCSDAMVVPIANVPWDATTGRRGFLCAGVTLGTLLSMAGELDSDRSADPAEATAKTEKTSVYVPHWIRAHAGDLLNVVFSPDGQFLATTADDGNCRLWRISDASLVQNLEGVCGGRGSLAFSPKGHALALEGGNGSVELRSLPDAEMIIRAKLDSDEASNVTFSPGGNRIAFVSGDKMVELWDPFEATPPTAPFYRERSVISFGYLPDGKTIVFLTDRGQVTLRSVADQVLLASFASSGCNPESLAVFPDGTKLALGNAEEQVEFWEVPAGALAGQFKSSVGSVHSIEISRDGATLACAGNDVEVWRMPDMEQSRRFETLGGLRASCLAISPDGQYLAVGYTFGVVILFDLETTEIITYLYDATANSPGADGVTYTVQDNVTRHVQTYTMPCGTPVPPGAICTCNCVPGSASLSSEPLRLKLTCPANPVPGKYGPEQGFRARSRVAPAPRRTPTSGQICTCDEVCICVPICQAHKLCHRDSLVRTSAFDIMLAMGCRQFRYMKWAADRAESTLRWRIYEVMRVIDREQGSDLIRHAWSLETCLKLLYDTDDIVSTMGAQLLTRYNISGVFSAHEGRMRFMLETAAMRPWYLRSQ
jgi:WD40 repeat protein